MSETSKAWLELTAALLATLGTLSAAYGTYLITQWYHAFSLRDFILDSISVFGYIVTLRRDKAFERAARGGELSPNVERKKVSLSGIYLVAVGFVLQVISAFLLLFDSISNLFRQP